MNVEARKMQNYKSAKLFAMAIVDLKWTDRREILCANYVSTWGRV